MNIPTRMPSMTAVNTQTDAEQRLFLDVRAIIEEARQSVCVGVNSVQIDHNWRIGRRIVEEEQNGEARAEYGKRTIARLSARLCAEFGEGYSERNLRDFRAFFLTFPNSEIWHTRVPNLTWSHLRQIFASKYLLELPTEDELRLEIERERRLLESRKEPR